MSFFRHRATTCMSSPISNRITQMSCFLRGLIEGWGVRLVTKNQNFCHCRSMIILHLTDIQIYFLLSFVFSLSLYIYGCVYRKSLAHPANPFNFDETFRVCRELYSDHFGSVFPEIYVRFYFVNITKNLAIFIGNLKIQLW